MRVSLMMDRRPLGASERDIICAEAAAAAGKTSPSEDDCPYREDPERAIWLREFRRILVTINRRYTKL